MAEYVETDDMKRFKEVTKPVIEFLSRYGRGTKIIITDEQAELCPLELKFTFNWKKGNRDGCGNEPD